MSTPGPERVPSSVKVGKTTGQGKPPTGGAKKTVAAAKKAGPPAKKAGGGKGKKPVAPVKVSGGRSMGPMLVIGAVALVALAIIGFGVYSVVQGSRSWEDKVADIKGVVNYRAQKNAQIDDRSHKDGTLSYVTSPPVGGAHNPTPQNCNGDVYDAPIANEHAVHSLEHGAVWVTYKQGLPADQVAVLAKKVQGKDYTLMSPYAGLDKNVSVQVWGYQLKVDDVNDPRIDQFIKDTRVVAAMEPGVSCSGGNTTTGPVTAAANGTSMNNGK
nr:DUF3105 domain-containing protein [Actinoplanes subtropicus]